MSYLDKFVYFIKFSIYGCIAGLLVLFFMPASKMSFNWQTAQNAWQFYQSRQLATSAKTTEYPTPSANFSFSPAVQKAYPSVVSINAFRPKGIREGANIGNDEKILDVGIGFGSGIVLDGGYVVTNYHVIVNAERISINLADGRRRWVELVGFDRKTDIAILKTDIQDLRAAQLANSSEVQIGDIVMAIGSPFGENQSVSLGIVSAITHDPFARIQTDAAINNGNSGGPLINSKGEVIGINQITLASRGGGQTGVNYAIPIDKVKHIVNDIILHGRVKRNWLGIGAGALTLQGYRQLFPNIEYGMGLFVSNIEENSPANLAGIQVNDLIIRLDNQIITGISSFYQIFYETPVGKSVDFQLVRDGKTFNVQVQLVEEVDKD